MQILDFQEFWSKHNLDLQYSFNFNNNVRSHLMILTVNHNNCISQARRPTTQYAVKNTTIHISPCNLCRAQRTRSLLLKNCDIMSGESNIKFGIEKVDESQNTTMKW